MSNRQDNLVRQPLLQPQTFELTLAALQHIAVGRREIQIDILHFLPVDPHLSLIHI